MLYISKYDADSSITWLCIVCWSMNVRAVPKHVLTFSFLSPPVLKCKTVIKTEISKQLILLIRAEYFENNDELYILTLFEMIVGKCRQNFETTDAFKVCILKLFENIFWSCRKLVESTYTKWCILALCWNCRDNFKSKDAKWYIMTYFRTYIWGFIGDAPPLVYTPLNFYFKSQQGIPRVHGCQKTVRVQTLYRWHAIWTHNLNGCLPN